MLDIYKWSVLITAIFWTSFGLFAYIKNHKDFATKLFALLSLSFALYSYSWFFLLRSTDYASAFFFSRLLACAAPFIVIFYLHWALTVVDVHRKRKFIIALCYLVNFVFFYFILTNSSYIADVRQVMFFPFWPIAGHNYIYFLVFGYGVAIFYSVYELIKGYLNSSGDKKHQIIYLMLGSLLGFGGGVTNFPLMYGLSIIQPFGVFAIMASPFIYSYAAVRYKLMDIKVVATQFFAGAINVIFIIRLILSESPQDYFFNGFLLAFVIAFTVLLIKGVIKEVRQREEIEKLANRLRSVNSILGHDVKAVLGKNRGLFSEMAEGAFGPISDSLKMMIQRLSDDTSKVLTMIMTILESGHEIKLSVGEFDFKAAVLEVVSAVRPDVEQKGLIIKSVIDETQDYNILADRDQLIIHVIRNLIENAINYTPKGYIEVRLLKNNPMSIVLSVKDSGVGITAEDKLKLFKEGGHGTDSIKVNVHSTGYGLFIAKKIVDSHGGKIWAESEGKDKGSTFFVELPTKGPAGK